MTGRIFIQVILPLRLEWEPFYYQEIELSESAGDASGLFPVTSIGSVTERDKEQVRVGDRVRVNFAGKEYVGVVSMADAGKQAEEMGIVDKVKPILGMAEGLEPVTGILPVHCRGSLQGGLSSAESGEGSCAGPSGGTQSGKRREESDKDCG